MPGLKFQPLKQTRGKTLVVPLPKRKKSCFWLCGTPAGAKGFILLHNFQSQEKPLQEWCASKCLWFPLGQTSNSVSLQQNSYLQVARTQQRTLPTYKQRFQRMGLDLSNFFSAFWGDPGEPDESSRHRVMGRRRMERGCKATAELPLWSQSPALHMGTIRNNYSHLGSCPLKS